MTDDNLFDDIDRFLWSQTGGSEEYVLFTEDEYATIITRFLASRGEGGASEDELLVVVRWFEEQRVTATVIDLVLKGYLNVDLKDGEVVTSLSGVGKQAWEKNQ